LKIDDDCLFRTDRSEELKAVINNALDLERPFYIGKSMNRKPARGSGSKWYMPFNEWPEKYYPTWFQGLAIFLSPGITGKLFEQALKTKYLFTDDVYIGVLVDRLIKTDDKRLKTDITVKQLKHFVNSNNYNLRGQFESWEHGPHVLYHVPKPKEFWLWSMVE
jgi:hypothetical protein